MYDSYTKSPSSHPSQFATAPPTFHPQNTVISKLSHMAKAGDCDKTKPKTMVIHTNDPEELCLANRQLRWTTTHLPLSHGPLHASLSGAWLPLCGISLEHSNRKLHIFGGTPNDSINYVLATQSLGSATFNGRSLDTGNIGILLPGETMDVITSPKMQWIKLSVPLKVANELTHMLGVAELKPPFPSGVTFRPPVLSQRKIRELSLGLLGNALDCRRGAEECCQRRKKLFVELTTTLILAPSSNNPDDSDKLHNSHTIRCAQRARDYMEAHIENDGVTLAEICEATGVGVRTLQRAFSTIYNVSPMNYLKRRRLYEIHKQLRESHPSLTTVAEIAAQWGFWHFGHFSQDYKKMFGQKPSQTLSNNYIFDIKSFAV